MELSSLKPHPKLVALLSQCLGGRFRVDRMIAVGGMAAVYEGCQESVGRVVAIKVLLPELQDQASYRERFQREIDVLCRLDHPFCVRLLDAGETDDGIPYLVTEFVEGRELETLLGRPFSPDRATRITAQLLDALEHIHAQGVVHRDLKPANIILSTDRDGLDVIKIVDFGVAKDVRTVREEGSQRQTTERGVVFGTPGFMSPEQVSGQSIDYRSDLYAVGLLLVAMLTGRPPFEDGDVETTITKQKEGQVPSLPPELSAPLVGVIRGLLAKEPHARYGSARVAAEALRRAVQPDTSPIRVPAIILGKSAAEDDSQPSPEVLEPSFTAPHRRRSKKVVAAGVLCGVAVVAVAVGVSATMRPPAPPDADAWVEATPEVTLEEIDAMMAQGELRTASSLLEEKLGARTDGAVLWRKGRVMKQLGHRAHALDLYGRALAEDEDLRDDSAFFVELRELMDDPELEPQAIDIALAHLEHRADDELVRRLNRKHHPLDYVTRHRVWKHVREGELEAQVDVALNLELDVRQSAFAPRPCVAYAQVLAAMDDHPYPRLIDIVARTPPPQIEVAEDKEICAQLPVLREQTLQRPPSVESSGLDGSLRASIVRLIRPG